MSLATNQNPSLAALSHQPQKKAISGLERIKNKQLAIGNDIKAINAKLTKYIDNHRNAMLSNSDSYHDVESRIFEEKAKYESLSKSSMEIYDKLQLEKNLLTSSIAHQEKVNGEMESLVFQKLPKEFSNIEFLYKKENEIHQKIKRDNSFNNSQEELISEIKEIIELYKEVSGIEVSKTPEGWLKIILMKGIKNAMIKEDICIVFEIKQGKYHITQMVPKFSSQIYEDELNQSQNITLFLCKVIVNEYTKFLI